MAIMAAAAARLQAADRERREMAAWQGREPGGRHAVGPAAHRPGADAGVVYDWGVDPRGSTSLCEPLGDACQPMTDHEPAPRRRPLLWAALLRCPRCGGGRLFRGLFRMEPGCGRCGLSFEREPGFYLGSIYVNYGATVIGTGLLYGFVVAVLGLPHDVALAASLAVAVLFPILFFRHARGLLLALDGAVNRHQSQPTGEAAGQGGDAADATAAEAGRLAGLKADDASAGCMMGVVLVLIIAFGLLMAAVSLHYVGAFSGPAADAVNLD